MAFKYFTGTTNWFSDEHAKAGVPGDQGILSMILEKVAEDHQHSEVIGTGDGTLVTFSDTLTNTPIASGQLVLKYKIGTSWHYGWMNFDGSAIDGHNIDSSSVNLTTGAIAVTFGAPIVNLEDVTAIYSIGDPGEDWLVLFDAESRGYSGTDMREVILKNSGVNGDDHVMVGIREMATDASQYWIWNLNCYIGKLLPTDNWEFNLAIAGRPAFSGNNYTNLPSLYFKNNDTNNWYVYSSKRCITGFVNTAATLDMPFYLGFVKRVMEPSLYVYPCTAIGTGNGLKLHSDIGIIWLGNNLTIRETNTYASTGNILNSPGGHSTGYNFKANPSGKVTVWPIYLLDNVNPNPFKINVGELEGIYALYGNSFLKNDTIASGDYTYLVLQDVYRTAYDRYLCVITGEVVGP